MTTTTKKEQTIEKFIANSNFEELFLLIDKDVVKEFLVPLAAKVKLNKNLLNETLIKGNCLDLKLYPHRTPAPIFKKIKISRDVKLNKTDKKNACEMGKIGKGPLFAHLNMIKEDFKDTRIGLSRFKETKKQKLSKLDIDQLCDLTVYNSQAARFRYFSKNAKTHSEIKKDKTNPFLSTKSKLIERNYRQKDPEGAIDLYQHRSFNYSKVILNDLIQKKQPQNFFQRNARNCLFKPPPLLPKSNVSFTSLSNQKKTVVNSRKSSVRSLESMK